MVYPSKIETTPRMEPAENPMSYGFTLDEYQQLWFLALQGNQRLLLDRVENIAKGRGLDIKIETVAAEILETAQTYLKPPTEASIVRLEDFVSDWHYSSNPQEAEAYDTIIKLVREFHNYQRQQQSLQILLDSVDQAFVKKPLAACRALPKLYRDKLFKEGAKTVSDIFSILNLEALSINPNKLWSYLSYDLAIDYTQKRSESSKDYTHNLQQRAFDFVKSLVVKKEVIAIT